MSIWKLRDHTADLALEGRGSTPEGALSALCRGLLVQLLGNGALVVPLEPRTVEVDGVDRTDVIVSALGELLYLVQVERWIPAQVEAAHLDEEHGMLVMAGEPFDTRRHRLQQEIKAATFHDFAMGRRDDGLYYLHVIFDV